MYGTDSLIFKPACKGSLHKRFHSLLWCLAEVKEGSPSPLPSQDVPVLFENVTEFWLQVQLITVLDSVSPMGVVSAGGGGLVQMPAMLMEEFITIEFW